jgi:serine/threonine protein kinase
MNTHEPTSDQPPPGKTTADHQPGPALADKPTSEFRPASASQFGRYRILQTLGKGGMGAVYLAHDPQLDRQVALKVPNFGPDEEDKIKRFYREARAAARLRHPNICPVYEVSDDPKQPYLTMAFIEGKTLADIIATGRLQDLRQAVFLVRKLALALAEAHAKGVIHRDLKPANIMVDANKEPVIMDFGLAKRIEESKPHTHLTHEGDVMGTPAYMPPEQMQGDQTAIGARSDIYSLGVILYELLAGKRPFQGTYPVLVCQVLEKEPPPPSQFRPDLDPALETICLKAMAKKPEARYASMTEFAEALLGFLRSGKPSTILPGKPSAPPTMTDTPAHGMASVTKLPPRPSSAPTKLPQPPAKLPQPPRAPDPVSVKMRPMVLAGIVALAVVGLLLLGIIIYVVTDNGTIKIELSDPKAQVEIKVDGNTVSLTGLEEPLKLRAGPHELHIEGKNFKTVAKSFTVKRGEQEVLKISLEPKEGPPPVAKQEPQGPGGGDGKLAQNPLPMPDLTGVKPTFADDFGDPASGFRQGADSAGRWIENPNLTRISYRDGKGVVQFFSSTGHAVGTWKDLYVADTFTLEVKGRTTTAASFAWAVNVIEIGDDNSYLHGFRVALTREGSLSVSKSPGLVGLALDHSLVHPATHALVRKGDDFNTVLIQVQGTQITLLVNGQQVCPPFEIKSGFKRGRIGLAVYPKERNAAAEFDDFKLWDAAALKAKSVAGGPGLKPDYDSIATGKWMPVLRTEAELKDAEGVTLENGVLRLLNPRGFARAYLRPFAGADMIVRFKVKALGTRTVELSLRGKRTSDADENKYTFNFEATRFDIGKGHLNTYRPLIREQTTETLNDWSEMAFAVIGDTLTGYYNGKRVAVAQDGELKDGYGWLAVRFGGALFKDVEIMILDKPAAEPVKKADYDAIATGKWMPVLRTEAEVKGVEGCEFADGVLRMSGENPKVYLRQHVAADIIMRAKVKIVDNGSISLNLRGEVKSDSSRYGYCLLFDRRRQRLDTCKDMDLTKSSGRTVLTRGQAGNDTDDFFEMAFSVVGDTLTGYVNGKALVPARDTTLKNGYPFIAVANGTALIKDVEVMILDKPPVAAAPLAPFTWPPDALRDGKVKAPDLSKANVLYTDEFDKADSGFLVVPNDASRAESGYRDGKYYIKGNAARRNAKCKTETAFACRLVGRVFGHAENMWTISLDNHQIQRSVRVGITRTGELWIGGGQYGRGWWPYLGEKEIGPITHAAIKPGTEFNELLVIYRGRTLEVYVNGVAVCNPVTYDTDLLPVQPSMGVYRQDNNIGEFERITLWSAEGLPTLEERVRRGEVAPAQK